MSIKGNAIIVGGGGSTPSETKSVALDMASGDQVITPTAGKLLSQVTVQKPNTLIAGNIKKNVVIGGITGDYEGSVPTDTTATATDIEHGKTAYCGGVKVTGTRRANEIETQQVTTIDALKQAQSAIQAIINARISAEKLETYNSMKSIKEDYDAYEQSCLAARTAMTSEAVTLYSPAQNINHYMICKKDSGFRIIWGVSHFGVYSDDATSYNLAPVDNTSVPACGYDLVLTRIYFTEISGTLEDAINAMKSPGLIYQNYVESIVISEDTDHLCVSNAIVFNKSAYYVGRGDTTFVEPTYGRISSNETIVAQS